MTTDNSPAAAAPDGAGGAEAPEPVYTAVEDWVIDYFLPMFRRTLGGEYRWCGQWWQHGEAISRLTSLWHAWEVLRLQPGTGIARLVPRPPGPPAAHPDGRPRPLLPVQRNRPPRAARSRRRPSARGVVGHQHRALGSRRRDAAGRPNADRS